MSRSICSGVVVKAGIGRGRIALELAERTGSLLVVDPSVSRINEFIAAHSDDPRMKNIRFAAGHFSAFPVDYYAADLVVCVDYLDVIESGPVINEFRRSLQFDGHFFFAGTVLNDEDLEGVYDDLMRLMHPLHNDYYLGVDFRTVMELKEFTERHGAVDCFDRDLNALRAGLDSFYNGFADVDRTSIEEQNEFIEANRTVLEQLYALDGQGHCREYYMTAVYRRN
jgi:ubiquinone/menaquinone biosynthesis C-methylase UbiE